MGISRVGMFRMFIVGHLQATNELTDPDLDVPKRLCSFSGCCFSLSSTMLQLWNQVEASFEAAGVIEIVVIKHRQCLLGLLIPS